MQNEFSFNYFRKAIKVRGTKIKLAGEHPDVGIFFVAGDGGRTRVENDEIITNNPSELTVMVPLLPAGTYRPEIVTQYSGGASLLKESRTAVSFPNRLRWRRAGCPIR